MYILSSQQIAKTDKATVKINKISSINLMEHAATLCFNWLHSRLQGQQIKIHVLCGIGNNGGDGLVIARHLYQHGYNVDCYIVNFSDKRSDDFLHNYNILKELKHWPTIINSKLDFPEISVEDIVVDCIFGNGLSKSPQGFTKDLIQYINNTGVFTLSIDLPSGLYGEKSISDTNAVIKSNHILTFQTPKLALLLADNKDFVHSWEIVDIGLDTNFIESLNPTIQYITKKEALSFYKPREKWSHKGTYGHSLLIGGSFGKIGAISLAVKGSLKIGSGLVSAYIPKCGYTVLQTAIPECMVEVDQDDEIAFFNFKTKPTVIGIGSGMGTNEATAKGFERFLSENKTPLVIDADAINLLASNPNLLKLLPKFSVLTPHPKELERLIGSWKNDYEKLEKALEFSKKHTIILVLKDAITVTVFNEKMYFNSTGNPALATGGSGDVLAGIITGLIAQGYEPLNASIFGVYLHGKTAELAVQKIAIESFTASTILDYLSDAVLDLFINDDFSVETENVEP
ncbi:MAG: NAD(P)H-hydrate dehydratase [Lutibacter sp.]|nr:NAD(P)H-hydrate dehydratase [Lutibacter sp.]